MITLRGLASGFREVGLKAGDSVIVHSSFRSLGKVDGGRETVIKALLETMRGKDVIDCVSEMIKDKPDVLLCTREGCKPCNGARKTLQKKGLI